MGGGNMPAFAVGDVATAFSGIIAFTMLPSPPADVLAKVSGSGGMHPKIMISEKIFGFIRKLYFRIRFRFIRIVISNKISDLSENCNSNSISDFFE
ncbi:hypothetical protein Hanom_Chr08g00731441 [Helianthus anomalus]